MYKFFKRLLDIFIAGIALILLSPILIPVMLILWVSGEHEVFYFQKRVGYKNKEFNIWKFATMLKNSPNMGTGEITLRNDPRVLPFVGAEEHILELHHAGVGEQQRRVVARDERAGGHDGVPLGSEEVEEILADLRTRTEGAGSHGSGSLA